MNNFQSVGPNEPEEVLRLRSLKRALDASKENPPDPKAVRPVIRPFNLGSAIPFYQFPCKDLFVLWVISSPSAVANFTDQIYITHAQETELQRQGHSLPKLALRNIFDMTGRKLSSHGRSDEAGRIVSLGLMHEDGYGPARMLFHPYFERFFPEGYWIAVPGRSEAMAFSKTMTLEEKAEAEAMIRDYFAEGEGVCDRLLEPEDVAVPTSWLEDADKWFDELRSS